MSFKDASPNTDSATLVIENITQVEVKYVEFNINKYSFWFGLFTKKQIESFESQNVYAYMGCHSHPATVHYKASIINDQKEKLFTREYDWTFDGKCGKQLGKFISCEQMLKPENNYLTNGTLTVLCEAELIDQNNPKPLQDLNNLSDNLQCLLTDGKLSDATLVVGKDGKEFRVHKTILTARSPVFAAMFEHDCEEKRLGKVTITDMDVDVCQELVRYIYTGKVDKLDRYAMDLLEAADKYQLDSLKYLSEQYLASNITVETAAKVLILADMHRAIELKAKCIQFITHNACQVKGTDQWKVLETKDNYKLLSELFLYATSKIN